MPQMTMNEIYQAVKQLSLDEQRALVERLEAELLSASPKDESEKTIPPGSLAAHARAATQANIQAGADDLAARSREILAGRVEEPSARAQKVCFWASSRE